MKFLRVLFYFIFVHFPKFLSILGPPILCVKISTDISDISIKSKYRYIRNYRYFHHWTQIVKVEFYKNFIFMDHRFQRTVIYLC